MFIIDPKQTKPVKIKDITFMIRGITGREQMEILPAEVIIHGEFVPPSSMNKIVELGLVDWKDGIVPFNKKDQRKNMDLLSVPEIVELFTEILAMSRVGTEQVKNSEQQST